MLLPHEPKRVRACAAQAHERDVHAEFFAAEAAREEYEAERSRGDFARIFHRELAKRWRECEREARRQGEGGSGE